MGLFRRGGDGSSKCNLSEDELLERVYENPELRRRFIERVKGEVEDALNAVFVEAIKAANEREPVWWQWLLLFVFGALAGVGLGVVIGMKVMGGEAAKTVLISAK
jgi:hypothetical protein